MSDTMIKTPLRQAREAEGRSREKVAAALDPPVSSKTIERWEKPGANVPGWRLKQLAALYGVGVKRLAHAA